MWKIFSENSLLKKKKIMFCIKTSKFAIQNVFILKLCFQTHFNTKCDIINFIAKCYILLLKIMFIKRGYSPHKIFTIICNNNNNK